MHIDAILKAVVDHSVPTVANDVLRILKHMYDYAIKHHIVQNNPAAAFNLSDAGSKDAVRERHLKLLASLLLCVKLKDLHR